MLPRLPDIHVIINNAGVQNQNDIDVNLKGTISITEHYGIQPQIRSIIMIGSASGHTGSEFPEYAASKGGVLAYTKNVAMRIAKYQATCNSLDFGGVMTELNQPVMEDPKLWKEIMELTPLKRWMTVEEAAEWIYFMSWQKPSTEKCPKCGSYMVEKGNKLVCGDEHCGYVKNK